MTVRTKGIIALIVTVTIWGATFVITQAALDTFGPFTINMVRYLIASALLLPFAWRRGFRFRLVLDRQYMLVGFTAFGLYYVLQNVGLRYTSAASASLISAGVPIVAALLSAIFLRERVVGRQWIGIALAVVGTVLVVWGGASDTAVPNAALGNALIVGSVLVWGWNTIVVKRAQGRHDALVITTASFFPGIVIHIPLVGWELAQTGLPSPDLAAIMAVLFLAIVGSALTMWLWNVGIQSTSAATAGAFVNLVPLVGVLLALLLGDRVASQQIVGGLLSLTGVWISSMKTGQAAQMVPAEGGE